MLNYFETFDERNDFLWSVIHTSQELIKAIKTKPKSDLATEVIDIELELIKTTYGQLKELRRWYNEQQQQD